MLRFPNIDSVAFQIGPLKVRWYGLMYLFGFVGGYGLARFFVEFFREPDPQLGLVLGPFSMGQVLSLFMVLLSSVFLAATLRAKRSSNAPLG